MLRTTSIHTTHRCDCHWPSTKAFVCKHEEIHGLIFPYRRPQRPQLFFSLVNKSFVENARPSQEDGGCTASIEIHLSARVWSCNCVLRRQSAQVLRFC